MSFIENLTVSCLSASLAEFITLPLDTTRIYIQNNQIKPKIAIKNIYQSYGINGFYKSFIPSILRSSTSTGIRLGLYQSLSKYNREYNIPKPIIGGVCGLISQFTSMPFDVIKSQIQANLKKEGQNLTMMSRYNYIKKNQGIKGFYQGYLQVSQRSIIISSIQGPIYFTLKDEILPNSKLITYLNYQLNIPNSIIIHNISAVTTTMVVTGIVYPIDLCKTVAMNNYDKGSSTKIIKELIKNNGYRSIYRGLSVGFCRALPHFWLTTGFIELFNKYLYKK